MELFTRELLLVADLAYRFRQVDGSGPVYDAPKAASIGQALDDSLRELHKAMGRRYSKKPAPKAGDKLVVQFALQETISFPEGPPQREGYESDEAFFDAVKAYEVEWRKEHRCPGCADPGCPQCRLKHR